MAPVRVLFVCLGNICRSPSAEGVFRHLVAEAGLARRIEADSAGTGDYHLGAAPDRRAQAAARRRGVELSGLRARQVEPADFERFDYVLAMDQHNLRDLRRLAPSAPRALLGLLLDEAAGAGGAPGEREVPDPYTGGGATFERALDLIEAGAAGWLARIRSEHGL